MANVFITGVSSGFGKLTAERLLQTGHRVVGGSRRVARWNHPSGLWVPLDVNDARCVDDAVQQALHWLGHLDVVINNAGLTHNAFIEETTIEDAQAVFDTNFWGVVRVNTAVIPHFRERRSGQIILLGSLAGLVGAPGQGFYSASKHALEGYAETLAAEISLFNIVVNILEPGFYRTEIHRVMKKGGRTVPAYDHIRSKTEAFIEHAVEHGGDPMDVVRTIETLIRKRPVQLRHPVGARARWVPRLRVMLPDQAFRSGTQKMFKLTGK